MGLFKKAIESNEAKLLDNLEVDISLWTKLQARKILTKQQLENCKTEVSYSFVLAFGNWKEYYILHLGYCINVVYLQYKRRRISSLVKLCSL